MERRSDERDHRNLARSMEKMTGKAFPSEEQTAFLNVRQEIDLVRSGLEDMIVQAFAEISQKVNAKEQDVRLTYREAAYQLAIGRIASAYTAMNL